MTRARRRLCGLAAGAFTAALTLPGCSLLLDFDGSDAGPGDANTTDVAVPPWDAGPDLYEPNEAPASAIELDPGSYALTLAPSGDQDYWRIVLGETSDVTIDALIVAGDDLDLELFSINDPDEPIDWSRGAGDRERIERSAPRGTAIGPGVFVVRVYAFNGSGIAHYRLSLDIAAAAAP